MKDFMEKTIKEWKEANVYFEDIINNHPKIANKAIDDYFKVVIVSKTLCSENYKFSTSLENILLGVRDNLKDTLNKNILSINGTDFSDKDSRYVKRYIRDRICSYHNCIEGFTITVKEGISTELIFEINKKLLME